MTAMQKQAHALADKLGVDVEPDAYCIGYWLRIANEPKPSKPTYHRGWERADRELEEEPC